jgi:hypothetical protein
MAAVTVNSRKDSVFGDRRAIMANISAAATGDTWVTGLKNIDSALADGGGTVAVNTTIAGGTVTLNYAGGGAAANVDMFVVGA